jgi:hypothetical protein
MSTFNYLTKSLCGIVGLISVTVTVVWNIYYNKSPLNFLLENISPNSKHMFWVYNRYLNVTTYWIVQFLKSSSVVDHVPSITARGACGQECVSAVISHVVCQSTSKLVDSQAVPCAHVLFTPGCWLIKMSGCSVIVAVTEFPWPFLLYDRILGLTIILKNQQRACDAIGMCSRGSQTFFDCGHLEGHFNSKRASCKWYKTILYLNKAN